MADFTDADLQFASLLYTNLSDATLTGANLTRAYYNGDTTFPDGFDPVAEGLVRFDSSNTNRSGQSFRYLWAPGADVEGGISPAATSPVPTFSMRVSSTWTSPMPTSPDADLAWVSAEEFTFSGANFTGADLTYAYLGPSNFNGATFNGTDMMCAGLLAYDDPTPPSFTGATWVDSRCPNLTESSEVSPQSCATAYFGYSRWGYYCWY